MSDVGATDGGGRRRPAEGPEQGREAERARPSAVRRGAGFVTGLVSATLVAAVIVYPTERHSGPGVLMGAVNRWSVTTVATHTYSFPAGRSMIELTGIDDYPTVHQAPRGSGARAWVYQRCLVATDVTAGEVRSIAHGTGAAATYTPPPQWRGCRTHVTWELPPETGLTLPGVASLSSQDQFDRHTATAEARSKAQDRAALEAERRRLVRRQAEIARELQSARS